MNAMHMKLTSAEVYTQPADAEMQQGRPDRCWLQALPPALNHTGTDNTLNNGLVVSPRQQPNLTNSWSRPGSVIPSVHVFIFV